MSTLAPRHPLVVRFLVVDDDADTLASLTRLVGLVTPWAEVMGAESGREAIDLAKRHRIDIVLVDAIMPIMGGSDVLRWFRDNSPNTHRMMMSGFDQPPWRQLAHAFLPKPFGRAELQAALAHAAPQPHR
jgi:CheY-like chemotaxis protein